MIRETQTWNRDVHVKRKCCYSLQNAVLHNDHSICICIQRIDHALTIEDLDDLLADEVLDFIIIDYSLFKDRETKRENKRANIN